MLNLNKLNLNNDRDWRLYNLIVEYYINKGIIEELNEDNCELITNVVWNSFIQYDHELIKEGLITECYDNRKINLDIELLLKKFMCEDINVVILKTNLNNSFAFNIKKELFL